MLYFVYILKPQKYQHDFRVTAVGDMQEVVVKDEEEQYFLFEKDISDLQYYLFNMNYPSLSPSQCKFIGIE